LYYHSSSVLIFNGCIRNHDSITVTFENLYNEKARFLPDLDWSVQLASFLCLSLIITGWTVIPEQRKQVVSWDRVVKWKEFWCFLLLF